MIKLREKQAEFLKSNLGMVISDREYSEEERDGLTDRIADYMMTHGSFEPFADEVVLMCESIIDAIVDS